MVGRGVGSIAWNLTIHPEDHCAIMCVQHMHVTESSSEGGLFNWDPWLQHQDDLTGVSCHHNLRQAAEVKEHWDIEIPAPKCAL